MSCIKGSWFTAPGDAKEFESLKLDNNGVFGIAKEEWFSARSALMVIDMQNYSINREWNFINALFNNPEMRERVYIDYYDRLKSNVIPNIIKLIKLFRSLSLRIVFIQYASSFQKFDDMNSFHRFIWSEIERNTGKPYTPTSGAFEIIKEIVHHITDDDIFLRKITNGAFTSTRLDTILRNMGIKSIVVCGAWTNCCVETTVREAFDRGYLVSLIEDACIAAGKSFHDATCLNLGSFYCNVCTTEEAIGEMKNIHST